MYAKAGASDEEVAMPMKRSPQDKKGHMSRSDELAEKKQRETEGKKSLRSSGEQGSRMPRR
jgi:hypothetical protein